VTEGLAAMYGKGDGNTITHSYNGNKQRGAKKTAKKKCRKKVGKK